MPQRLVTLPVGGPENDKRGCRSPNSRRPAHSPARDKKPRVQKGAAGPLPRGPRPPERFLSPALPKSLPHRDPPVVADFQSLAFTAAAQASFRRAYVGIELKGGPPRAGVPTCDSHKPTYT